MVVALEYRGSTSSSVSEQALLAIRNLAFNEANNKSLGDIDACEGRPRELHLSRVFPYSSPILVYFYVSVLAVLDALNAAMGTSNDVIMAAALRAIDTLTLNAENCTRIGEAGGCEGRIGSYHFL